MASLLVKLLGSFQVTLNSRSITGFESDKTRALFAYLLTEADRPHRRDALAGLLWPEVLEASARRSLSQALFNLRQNLPEVAGTPPFFITTRETIQFNSESAFELDVQTFNTQLKQGQLAEAVATYAGDFLRGFFIEDSSAFEEWALVQREELRRLVLSALSQLTQNHEQAGQYEAALRYAGRQLEIDPWREEAHRQKMRALALSGQRGAALIQYEACRKALLTELGVEPSAETRALYEQIQQDTVRPPKGEPTPAGRLELSPLPKPLAPFIGRERELAEIEQRLAEPECRLLTLVGPGGIGKTRLAIETASRQSPAFADGVVFIQLQPLNSADGILPALAAALGHTFYGQAEPLAQLIRLLGPRQMLLVFDNFEHVLDGVGLVTELLQAAPQLKILVTSREALEVEGEWLLEIKGFEAAGASALFTQRARQAWAGFTPANTDQLAMARLSELVGGLPLALVLAATWVRTLSVAEIVTEIERDVSVLATTQRDLPERHRSMQAVFNHSWQFLSEDERRCLRQLSIFRGGFTREAADKVAGASLSVLAALVSKSFLRRTATGRYDPHELVRQYAAARLQTEVAGEAEEVRQRHAGYYAEQFRRWLTQLDHATHAQAVAEMTIEIDNVRLAWETLLAQSVYAEVALVARGLGIFFDARGWSQTGIPMFQQAAHRLRATPSVETKLALGEVLFALASLYSRLSQSQEALRVLEENVAQLTPLGDSASLARSLRYIAEEYHSQGLAERVREHAEASIAMSQRLGAPDEQAMGYVALGYMEQAAGQAEAAYRCFADCVRLVRPTGKVRYLALALQGLSLAARHLERYDEAQTSVEESRQLCQQLNDDFGAAVCFGLLGGIALANGQAETAASWFLQSATEFERIQFPYNRAIALVNLGRAYSALEQFPLAEQTARTAFAVALEAQTKAFALNALVVLAEASAKCGQRVAAVRWLSFAIQNPATYAEFRLQAERCLAELVAQLPAAQVAEAQRHASALTFEQLEIGQ